MDSCELVGRAGGPEVHRLEGRSGRIRVDRVLAGRYSGAVKLVMWIAGTLTVLAGQLGGCAHHGEAAKRSPENGPDNASMVPQVRALFDPTRRDAALLALMRINRFDEGYGSCPEPDEPRVVRHVVRCPQHQGPDMVAVFTVMGHDDERMRPGLAMGYVVLFRADGSIVPFWEGSNYVEVTGKVQDLNADGIIDTADVNPLMRSDDGAEYYELYVVPVTPAQKATLIVWWEAEDWGWEAVDSDGDRIFEIRIGPVTDGTVLPAAVYRWSTEEESWVGPKGSALGPFLRPDPDGEGADANAFLTRLAQQ